MNKLLFSLIATASLSIGVCNADDIPIYYRDDPTVTKDEVPVTGDYDKDSKELALKFSESSVYDVAVLGPKGIVFSAKVDVKTYHEVRVRVS